MAIPSVNVQLDIAAMRRDFKEHQREVNKAAARAMERVAVTGRKVAQQRIRQSLNLNARIISDKIVIVRPFGRQKLIRSLVASGDPVPLRDFSARETRKGVTFAVKRGSRKVYERENIKGFIHARFGRHVFVRIEPDPPGERKGRIKKVFGPSIPQYFVTSMVRRPTIQTIEERWPVEFDREIQFRKGKLGIT